MRQPTLEVGVVQLLEDIPSYVRDNSIASYGPSLARRAATEFGMTTGGQLHRKGRSPAANQFGITVRKISIPQTSRKQRLTPRLHFRVLEPRRVF